MLHLQTSRTTYVLLMMARVSQFIIVKLHYKCISTDWSPLTNQAIHIRITYWIIILGTVLFRFRHTLRYFWLKHKMHRLHLERHLLDPKYRYDAFVSCDRCGAIWVKQNFLPNLKMKKLDSNSVLLKETS